MDRELWVILANSLRDVNRINDTLGTTKESYRQQTTVLIAAIGYILDASEGYYHPEPDREDGGRLTSLSELDAWLREVEL